ncbi:unnamed protein product [Trichogramma brassicae]|uniref:Reverse transcriptase zinc-binding domain-containing protein n=1 Tax=Trichogramma brassicae TaxID=86971 RepID=A0A6H5ISB2_9HYME|nr:unnamed protein product [Trichogramma brassicae]
MKDTSTYADILRTLKSELTLQQSVGSSVRSMRPSTANALVLQLGKNVDDASTLGAELGKVLGDAATANALQHTTMIEIRDLRKAYAGTQVAVTPLPGDLAAMALKLGQERIGWVESEHPRACPRVISERPHVYYDATYVIASLPPLTLPLENGQRESIERGRVPRTNYAHHWRPQEQQEKALRQRRGLNPIIWSPHMELRNGDTGLFPPSRVHRRACLRVISGHPHVSYEATYILAGIPPLALLADERLRINLRRPEDAKEEERLETLRKWQEQWDRSTKGRWTYRLIPNIREWNGYFKHHSQRYDNTINAQCPTCPHMVEDAEHVLFHCPRFEEERRRLKDLPQDEMKPENIVGIMLTSEPN